MRRGARRSCKAEMAEMSMDSVGADLYGVGARVNNTSPDQCRAAMIRMHPSLASGTKKKNREVRVTDSLLLPAL
jgi:hypothetical protein